MTRIKDSGTRTEFQTGAVRDGAEGKGRFDLLPIEALQLVMQSRDTINSTFDQLVPDAIAGIGEYLNGERDKNYLAQSVLRLLWLAQGESSVFPFEALQAVALVFEAGANKYADRNWEKGIPTFRYMDSGLRHLFKHLSGHTDEPHLAMATWNFLCLLQTELWIDQGVLAPELRTLPAKRKTPFAIAA